MSSLYNIFEKANVRVEWSRGKNNLLLIAPHGHKQDDTHTDVIIRTMANQLNCSYVLNFGWRRNKNFDAKNNYANCNDIRHVQRKEVCDFYDPIVSIINKTKNQFGECQILFIHGMGNGIRSTIPTIDAVIGYGDGTPPRHICDAWRKDLLIDMICNQGWDCYEGGPGGKFSAHDKNNLAQALCNKQDVHGIQIEIIEDRRYTEKMSEQTAKRLSVAVQDYIDYSIGKTIKTYKRIYKVGQV